jgi:hypothetical protein
MIRHLLDRWKNWLGDSSLERAIRNELVRQGYPRQASKIVDARMIAVERPGWIQVWRFRIDTHRNGEPILLFGAARDDGRVGTKVLISHEFGPVEKQLALWSEGLIVRRK